MMKKKKAELVFAIEELTKYYKTTKNIITTLFFGDLKSKTIYALTISYAYLFTFFSFYNIFYLLLLHLETRHITDLTYNQFLWVYMLDLLMCTKEIQNC